MGDIIINGDVIFNVAEEEKSNVSLHKLRTSSAVSTAKKKVKQRDGVCICCGDIGVNGHLEIHHILPISRYKELASDTGNMIALCQKCHHKYHEMYSDNDVNAVTFAKYLKDYGNSMF